MPRQRNYTPPIEEVGFDFDWDEAKVWALDEPVIEMPLAELEWHLDYPFFWEGDGKYNLTPREVMEHPTEHQAEYDRVMAADTSYPVDVMENKGRLLLLDGLHRLTKLAISGAVTVKARMIPRSRIPEIVK